MPHSTTGTTSYVLIKYSRSYPTKRISQRTQAETQHGPELAAEWQHFTNPTIRLVLDITRAPVGGTASVRLRILWQINSGLDYNQQDVVFASLLLLSTRNAFYLDSTLISSIQEDMDLLSFSEMASTVARKHPSEGLPLKAVYRDTVLGIRYLHNQDTGGVPTYRRFQISFQSPLEASEFINSIKPVCPCKMNSTPVPGPSAVQPNLQSQGITESRLGLGQKSQTQNRGPWPRPRATTSVIPSRQPFSNPVPIQAPTPMYARQPPPVSSPPSMAAFQDSSISILPTTSSPARPSLQNHMLLNASGSPPEILPSGSAMNISNEVPNFLASSLPPSSLSKESINSTQRRGADGPMDPQKEDIHPVLANLVESSSIYDLPVATLERVVGDVIREDGFMDLLEKLSDMLTIRRIANI